MPHWNPLRSKPLIGSYNEAIAIGATAGARLNPEHPPALLDPGCDGDAGGGGVVTSCIPV